MTTENANVAHPSSSDSDTCPVPVRGRSETMTCPECEARALAEMLRTTKLWARLTTPPLRCWAAAITGEK